MRLYASLTVFEMAAPNVSLGALYGPFNFSLVVDLDAS